MGDTDTIFKIEPNLKIIDIPDIKDRTQIDIKYPLIAPYAFAHISWNKGNEELEYNVEEPSLSESEKEILRLIILALEEMVKIAL